MFEKNVRGIKMDHEGWGWFEGYRVHVTRDSATLYGIRLPEEVVKKFLNSLSRQPTVIIVYIAYRGIPDGVRFSIPAEVLKFMKNFDGAVTGVEVRFPGF